MTKTSGERRNRLHIIDFGMASFYRCPRTGEHISDGSSRYFNGAVIFVSQRTHRYRQVSRRDDMESLAYLLVYLATGTLPWCNLPINHSNAAGQLRKMGDMKRNMPAEQIYEGTVGIKEYLAIVRRLSFTERPRYTALLSGLKATLEDIVGRDTAKYDWE
ncbi:kinase-like protein [Gracilaria domingensis]|nr:kinase-like protein [Gracilaria domingensis]